MLISLNSDFLDYYDHAFAGSWQAPDIVFDRQSMAGPDRVEMFKKLSALDLNTPLHGTALSIKQRLLNEMTQIASKRDVNEGLKKMMDVVVYHDIHAHRGEGKEVMNIMDAITHYPEHYCSQFIPTGPLSRGQSLRYLRIGARQFWLSYRSKNDWRSNVGDVSIKVLHEYFARTPSAIRNTETPLLAIDFVKADKLYAIDYNISPGLSGTGLESLISATDIYQQIATWYQLKYELAPEHLAAEQAIA